MEINKPYWQNRAEELFLAEYQEPKDFYHDFGSPTDLYNELARRVIALASQRSGISDRESAYKLMTDAYYADAAENDHKALEGLIITYSLLNEPD